MENQKEIFISHATKDKLLADALVDLLETAMGIPSSSIFCSSLDGLGVPSGKDFIQFIKEQIQQPKVVITLLTENYFASEFCLCELGATWAMSHNILPLLVPPLTYNKVQNVLKVTILDKIDNESDLNRFQDNLLLYLDRQHIASARSNTKKKAFLQNLNDTLQKIEKPIIINLSEYQTLKKEHENLIAESIKYENEITTLKAQIKKLENCKDASQVIQIKSESLSDDSKYETLIDNCRKALKKLDPIVNYTLYCYTNNDAFTFRNKYFSQQVKKACENGYIKFDEDSSEIKLNLRDTTIKNALINIDNLKTYFDEEISFELLKKLEDDYTFELSLSNLRFWQTFSNITSYV